MSKVTIEDVAKKAGVSVTSVSRVLNNRGYLSDSLKKKVNRAIEEIGYTPNEMARSFFRRESKSIALLIPNVQNPFFSELTYHVENRLAELNYNLYLCNSMNKPEVEKKYLNLLNEQKVDGILVGSHNINIKEYDSINGNIVSIDRYINDRIPIVSCDNYQGGSMATKLLLNSGCKHILCIVGDPKVDTPANLRRRAYESIMRENNMKQYGLEIPFIIESEERKKIIADYLKKYPQIDGIFAGDDITAIFTIEILRNPSIRVIGFDGTRLIQNLNPGLVTVVQPIQQIAEKSVDILIDIINEQEVKQKTILPVSLNRSFVQ